MMAAIIGIGYFHTVAEASSLHFGDCGALTNSKKVLAAPCIWALLRPVVQARASHQRWARP